MIHPSPTWAALTIAAIVIHLIVDWFFQNDWMAKNKIDPRHPAGYVHAGLHGLALLLIFPVWAALVVAVIHFIIDLRFLLAWWGRFFKQTAPDPTVAPAIIDNGKMVAYWRDQVSHIWVVAIVAIFLT